MAARTDHTAKILRNNTGKWFVEMWSMSETNARKAASVLIKASKTTRFVTNVQVVPVVEV